VNADRAAAALASLTLGLGLLAGTQHEIGGYGVEADFYGFYALNAERLAAGLSYEHARSGPGYSALLAVASFLTADLFAAAKVISALATAAFGWLAYRLIRSCAPPGVALLVQALTGVLLFRYSFTAGNDLLFCALSTGSLLLLLRAPVPRLRDALLAGAAGGLALVTRYTAAGLLFTAFCWLVLLARRPALFGAFTAAMCAASLPWWIANAVWHGSALHTQTPALMALKVWGGKDYLSSERLAEFEQRFLTFADVLRPGPGHVVAFYLQALYDDAAQFLRDTVTLPALLFAGGGLLALPGHPGVDRRRALAILLHAVPSFLFVVLVPYQARYYYPLLPIVLFPVALLLLDPRLAEHAGSRLATRLALGATLLVALAISAVKTRDYLTTEPLEVLPAAAVLLERARPGDAVMCRKPQISYLGRCREAPVPRVDGTQALIAWAKQAGVRFLYIGPREAQVNGSLLPLTTPAGAPPGLVLLHAHQRPDACLWELR
jgi:4-amino-4-deoxy-L-arabinose transferase-like glycosyltransferase